MVLLSVLALVSAALTIRATYRGPRSQVYLFKPLTTLLILLIALLAMEPPTQLYKIAIIAGLAFSLAGDIFLMLPANRFLAGLVSFLVAHLLYTVAFASDFGFYFSIWALLPFIAYGLVIMRLLWSHLGSMKGPALLYMVAILVMAWQATGRWLQGDELTAVLSFVGALLFVLSDSVLAIERFRNRFSSSQLIILSTYYAAQWLIALSVGVDAL